MNDASYLNLSLSQNATYTRLKNEVLSLFKKKVHKDLLGQLGLSIPIREISVPSTIPMSVLVKQSELFGNFDHNEVPKNDLGYGFTGSAEQGLLSMLEDELRFRGKLDTTIYISTNQCFRQEKVYSTFNSHEFEKTELTIVFNQKEVADRKALLDKVAEFLCDASNDIYKHLNIGPGYAFSLAYNPFKTKDGESVNVLDVNLNGYGTSMETHSAIIYPNSIVKKLISNASNDTWILTATLVAFPRFLFPFIKNPK